MERIKQAIENAKKPGSANVAEAGVSSVGSINRSGAEKAHGRIRWDIVKYVIAVTMIIFAGWLWMRLDFMNRLELIASEYIHDGVKQARAEARKRQEDEAKFRQLISANLAHCREAAEKDKENYMALAQKQVRIKNRKQADDIQVKFYIPKAAMAEAERMLEGAKAECQQVYETQLKNGR